MTRDKCAVTACPERWRCLDVDTPSNCALWRMCKRNGKFIFDDAQELRPQNARPKPQPKGRETTAVPVIVLGGKLKFYNVGEVAEFLGCKPKSVTQALCEKRNLLGMTIERGEEKRDYGRR